MSVVHLSRRALGSSRSFRNGGIHMFVPNESQYVFKGERLSPQENANAIPHRPQPKTKRFYNDIIQPEQAVDVITRFTSTDVIRTCLSSNSVVHIASPPKGTVEPVELYFTNVATKWMEDFDKLVFLLKDMPETNPTFYRYKLIEDLGLEVPESISGEWLVQVMEKYNMVKNSTLILQGKVLPMDAAALPTFELLAFYLLGQEPSTNHDSNLSLLVASIAENIHLIPLASLEMLVELLVYNLHRIGAILKDTFTVFNNIVDHTVAITGSLYLRMSPLMADTLAYEFIRSKNLDGAKDVLQALVQESKIAPTSSTVDALLNAYSSNENVLLELLFMKPVFFHKNNMSPTVFQFLMLQGVKSEFDLSKLVQLLEVHGKAVLEQYQYELIDKLCQMPINTLSLTQLIKRLVVDNGVQLNEQTMDLADRKYKELGESQSIVKFLNE